MTAPKIDKIDKIKYKVNNHRQFGHLSSRSGGEELFDEELLLSLSSLLSPSLSLSSSSLYSHHCY